MEVDRVDTPAENSRRTQIDLGFYRFVIESLPVGVLTVDSDLRINSLNPWAAKLTGYTAEEALGRFCGEILHGGKCEGQCPLQSALSLRNPILRVETTIQNSLGETIPVRMNTAALRNAAGKLLGGVEAFQDISYLKSLEREKDNFISMTAHDMKSSLMLVGAFAYRLLQKDLDNDRDKKNKYLEIIKEEAGKLETLIEEFLGFSRLQAGRLNLNVSTVSVDKILLEMQQVYEPKAAELGLKLEVHTNPEMPLVEGDSVHLRRVFTNLLDNAFKFSTKGGTITVSSEVGQQGVVITVTDEGLGIAPGELPYIFDAFHRGKIGENIKGFGLGLASVKAVVEAHGGKALVESELGKGSQFTVILPKPSHR